MASTAREYIELGLVSRGRNLPGFSGGYWLMNPATGDGLAFTFFDTVANLEASAAQAGRLRGDASRNIGAEMAAVAHFEVAADTDQKVHRQASHARVLNFEGDPARLDDIIEMVPATFVLAWGRDYGDVSPVKGVNLGGGRHAVSVGVDVAPLAKDGWPP